MYPEKSKLYFTLKMIILPAYVKVADVFMDKDYMTSIFDSCKGVSSPSTGGLLLDAVCGSYGAAYCTAERYIFPPCNLTH